jgi:hypothetical protein
MTYARVTDHVARARARLLEQLKYIPGIVTILENFDDQIQAIEDALWQVFSERSLSVAEGEQLNVIGRVLDEPRDGYGDDDYRARLTAKIRVLRSSGSATDLLKIYKLLLPDNVVAFTAMGGGGFILDIGAIDTALAYVYQRFLLEAKSAGIYAHLLYSDDGGGSLLGTFAFSDNSDPTVVESSATRGFGDEADPDTGGTLSGVIV